MERIQKFEVPELFQVRYKILSDRDNRPLYLIQQKDRMGKVKKVYRVDEKMFYNL